MALAPHFAGVDPALQAVPNWVLADLEKRPTQPNGKPASSTNPATWSSFEQVSEAYRPRMHVGIGIVLDGKPRFDGKYLHGFDWDHCIEENRIDLAVKAAVAALNITRLEPSVSGTGLRGFFLHDKPLPSRRTRINGRSVELYSAGHYLTTTGWAYPGREQLDANADIAAIERLLPTRASAAGSGSEHHSLVIRGACPYDAYGPSFFPALLVGVIEKVRADERLGPLYRGDLSRYADDHSAADLALCGAFARLGLDGPAIDTAMRTSLLYRDKWERDDYRERTISLALADGGSKGRGAPADPLAIENGLVDAGCSPPPLRDWLIEGLLVASKSAVLAGLSGMSKTQLALQLAMAVARSLLQDERSFHRGRIRRFRSQEI